MTAIYGEVGGAQRIDVFLRVREEGGFNGTGEEGDRRGERVTWGSWGGARQEGESSGGLCGRGVLGRGAHKP